MMAEGHLCDFVLNRTTLVVLRNDCAPIKADLDRAMPSPDFISAQLWVTLDAHLHGSPSELERRLSSKKGFSEAERRASPQVATNEVRRRQRTVEIGLDRRAIIAQNAQRGAIQNEIAKMPFCHHERKERRRPEMVFPSPPPAFL